MKYKKYVVFIDSLEMPALKMLIASELEEIQRNKESDEDQMCHVYVRSIKSINDKLNSEHHKTKPV